jgi:DNA-binding beta-propeller fold protein YncE
MGMYGLNQEVRSIAVSPENKYAYVVSGQKYNTGGSALTIFSIDSSAGTPKFIGCYPLDRRFMSNATSTAISPDGKNLFITYSNSLEVYKREELSGLVSFLQYFENGKAGVSGLNHAA